jgi:large repetitive protein
MFFASLQFLRKAFRWKKCRRDRLPLKRIPRFLSRSLAIEELEDRTLFSASPIPVGAVTLNDPVGVTGSVGPAELWTVTINTPGLLIAQVQAQGATGFPTRLSLLNPSGGLLIQSAGQTQSNPDDLIKQYVLPGTYSLEVETTVNQTVHYTLTTQFQASNLPFQGIPVGNYPSAIVSGVFTRSGNTDLAVANEADGTVSILLGNGDGAFRTGTTVGLPTGSSPVGLVVGDFNGDGNLDLATLNQGTDALGLYTVSVLLGDGQGNFQVVTQELPASVQYPTSIVAGHFNEMNPNDYLDLAIADSSGNDLYILLGNGDGTFAPGPIIPVGLSPGSMVVGHFTSGGHSDLAVADAGDVTVLFGAGDGTFPTQQTIPVPTLGALVAADFNGDGHQDLATVYLSSTNPDAKDVILLLGDGNGGFQVEQGANVVSVANSLFAGDFTGDGHVDLAVEDMFAGNVTLLLGQGDGTFQVGQRFEVGTSPVALTGGDFNADGHLDLATVNAGSSDVTILLGKGNGTFQTNLHNGVGASPVAMVMGDFTGDGILDIATVNSGSNDLSVLIGNGDGTFQPAQEYPVGTNPDALVVGDFNGDGRLDLAVANQGSNDVSVFLGVGDGTFQPEQTYAVGVGPVALVAADFCDNGRLDLATANQGSNDVSILLGNGDGTFQPATSYPVGIFPSALVVGDFRGIGRNDLATANAITNDVSVLLSNGDGTFQPAANYPVLGSLGTTPFTPLVVADFQNNGRDDLATANYFSNNVSILLSNADGTFQTATIYPVDVAPDALVVGHLESLTALDLAVANFSGGDVTVLPGDGTGLFGTGQPYGVGDGPTAIVAGHFGTTALDDLATVNNFSGDLSLLLNTGSGSFQAEQRFRVGPGPVALSSGDFLGTGQNDLAALNSGSNDVSVWVNTGMGTFIPGNQIADPVRATPIVADLNDDGVADIAVLNQAGQILVRFGRADLPGTFGPAIVVNPDPQFAARAFAVVQEKTGPVIVAIGSHDSSLTMYSLGPTGAFVASAGPVLPGAFLVCIAAGDLTGNGLDDIVIGDAASNQVFLFLQNASGGFGPAPNYQIPVGVDPSRIALADVDGDGRCDIVVTNQSSGDISVIYNSATQPFTTVGRFRAGSGLYGIDQLNGSLQIQSLAGTLGVAAGPFASPSSTDLVVTNRGDNSIALLTNTGTGGFLNTAANETFATDSAPTAVVTMQFPGSLFPEVAVLEPGSDEIQVFAGDGEGGFQLKYTATAGNAPTGLSVADVNGDGLPDLLVGNQFGDILILQGKADGTFEPYHRIGQAIPLAVADLTGNGQADFIIADQALDQVSVQFGGSAPSVFQDRSNGILNPTAVQLADLNGDGIPDLVVANAGGNNVLVYLGLGNGQFGPAESFFAGTDPVSITVADLTGDKIPDLIVANQGSNDISILLGQGTGSRWTMSYGPRLQTGGLGPSSTVVGYFGGNPWPDILVANSESNDVALLTDKGQGFFDDQHPELFPTGVNPFQVLVGNFDGSLDLVTVNHGSNDLTFISDFLSGGPTTEIDSGGIGPVAAVEGDFNHNGFSDLLVANNGDGRFGVIIGGGEGPTLLGFLSFPGLDHPSNIALAGIFGKVIELYATDEGRDAVARLGILLAPLSAEPIPSPLTSASDAAVTTLLVGIRQASDWSAPSQTVIDPKAALVPGTTLSGAPDLRMNSRKDPLDFDQAADTLIVRTWIDTVAGEYAKWGLLFASQSNDFIGNTIGLVKDPLRAFGSNEVESPPIPAGDWLHSIISLPGRIFRQLRQHTPHLRWLENLPGNPSKSTRDEPAIGKDVDVSLVPDITALPGIDKIFNDSAWIPSPENLSGTPPAEPINPDRAEWTWDRVLLNGFFASGLFYAAHVCLGEGMTDDRARCTDR